MALDTFIHVGATRFRLRRLMSVGALPAQPERCSWSAPMHEDNSARGSHSSSAAPMGAMDSACFSVSGPVNFSVMWRKSCLAGSM